MENWQEEMINMLLNIDFFDELEIFKRVKNAASALGFEYVAYGLQLPLPMTKPKVMTLSSYPSQWQKRYEKQGYLEIDPTVRHGLRSCEPLLWKHEIFNLTSLFWEEAQAEGLNFGWSQACADVHGLAGMLSLARSHEFISRSELAAKEMNMRWLTHLAHLTLSRRIFATFKKQHDPHLTAREIEVLRWTADGKSAEDIADILKISGNTVNFHIKNSTLKLSASNKTAAVLRAAMFGLLYRR